MILREGGRPGALDVLGGRLAEEQGHPAPDRFAGVTPCGCHTTGTLAPLAPLAAVSKPEPPLALIPMVRGGHRPCPSQDRHEAVLGSHAVSPSARECQRACAVIIIPPVFFARVIYFSERKECGEFTTGLAIIFFFFPAARQQPLLYEGRSRGTDGRAEEAEGPG